MSLALVLVVEIIAPEKQRMMDKSWMQVNLRIQLCKDSLVFASENSTYHKHEPAS